jgi:hypothetical protein
VVPAGVLATGLLVVVLSSCATATVTMDGDCMMPTAAARSTPSGLVLTLDPNPVSPGSEAILSVRPVERDVMTGGVAALFECWDGTQWIVTHTLHRGRHGEPSTVEGAVPIVALGIGVPNAYPILIPDVPPGIYRIRDTADEMTGVVTVWVR